MKRKEWIWLALALVLIIGGAVGLYQYRLAVTDANRPLASADVQPQTEASAVATGQAQPAADATPQAREAQTAAGAAPSAGAGQATAQGTTAASPAASPSSAAGGATAATPAAAGTTRPASGVSPQAAPAHGDTVQLWVTRDFGARTLIAKSVPVEADDTVMDVLKRYGGDVKTAYNGGFVEAIGGLASAYRPGDGASRKLDWFYYVNGVIGDVGAGEYQVHQGDVIWWDYHDWSFAINTPAQVGAYPQPFAKGKSGETGPLVIMYAAGYDKQAERIARDLARVRGEEVRPVRWDERQFGQDAAVIVVGDAAAVQASPFLAQQMKERSSSGLFVQIGDGAIQAYDWHGKPGERFTQAGTGVIAATLLPDSRKPLWIVSGIGAAGVDKAVAALEAARSGTAGLRGYFGAVLTDKGTVRLPIAGGE